MDEILRYFLQDEGFSRLVGGMWDLYARHGRCFGAVRLIKPLPEEEKAISEFFKRDYYDQALIRISLADFERQLQKTFEEAPGLGVFLEGYFSRPLTTHTEESKDRMRVRDSFAVHVKANILPDYEGTEAENWLKEMIAHIRRTYKQWAEAFITEPDTVTEQVKTVCNALNALPEDEYLLLSDFSEGICGNPQALDFYGTHGPLFMRALARRYGTYIPVHLEESIQLYWQAGLLSNGVLNQVTVSGIVADKACTHYDSLGEAHVLTLENISRFTEVTVYKGKVFIVESASVFALLCEQLRGLRCTLVCASSGLNAALDRLLTLCCESGAELYYSGNMDFKGLALGENLFLRFGKHFVPWRYDKDDYERASVQSDTIIPDEKRNVAFHNEAFASMLSHIRKKGKTTGHLPLVKLLAEDIAAYVRG
ncbi:MAG: TIGR02679 domain-containing protein [Defluviitaleaceae bacterium]|nr:TIGR02679 domain-containing protein [Defluviitaleaceae bacterium]